MTLLSLFEPTLQVRRVISEDDSSANELFDQTDASQRELQHYSSDILGGAPFRYTCPLKFMQNCYIVQTVHSVTHIDHALVACRGHFTVSGCFLLIVTYK